ncbi:MAG: hypothetical protein M1824_002070 [Vezdaea acicularis]|nr:MAG: hypothetical protein M1824_002070 [Vezdaea acicularis]
MSKTQDPVSLQKPSVAGVAPPLAIGTPPLTRRMCLGCFKQLGAKPNIVCLRNATSHKCTRCKGLKHFCHEIPDPFHLAANHLIGYADSISALPVDQESLDRLREELSVLVKRFTDEVEAWRLVNITGNGEVDAANAQGRFMERIAVALEAIADIH